MKMREETMSEEERAHMKRMVRHMQRERSKEDGEALTPDELAYALMHLKKKYPQYFPARKGP